MASDTFAALVPRSMERHARMTCAPCLTAASANALPIPALPPVTIQTCRMQAMQYTQTHAAQGRHFSAKTIDEGTDAIYLAS